MSGAVLFHVQHLLGIGHLQRALLITDALAREGLTVTLVTGGEPIAALAGSSAARIVQLPPVRARDASFALVDALGEPLSEALMERRRSALLAEFAETRPSAVILEGFPFARRAFRFELEPLIAATRAARPRPRLISSIRDILVPRDDAERQREIVRRVRADFDVVMVHGDPSFIALEASFPAAPEIADRLVYTGYVTPARETDRIADDGDRRAVLVSAGGGAVGYSLLSAALAARRAGCLADRPWHLLAGQNLPPAEFAALAQDCSDNVVIERHRQDFPEMLRRGHLSVSQAGYNTVLDVVAANIPCVLVPFADGREIEQRLRAERLAARGGAEIVPGDELSAERLASAMLRAVARRPPRLALDTGGAGRSARLIAETIRSGARRSNGV